MNRPLLLIFCVLIRSGWIGAAQSEIPTTYDIVVYGGTSGGVAAAVQARRMGRSVLLIEPTQRLGGLTTGGLGQTDIGNKMVIGGISREFYQRIREYYEDDRSWRWQKQEEFRDSGQSRTSTNEDSMWTFEPSAALKVINDLIREHDIPVMYDERLDLNGGVMLTRSKPWRIIGVRMESGKTFRGRMFIDATYEGDLLAKANVSYAVGREANAAYDETLNGVQTANARYHQLAKGVDPHVTPGDPSSGLLPGIDPLGPGMEGAGDQRVQAYCFRMCLTDHPNNRLPWTKPADYNELEYELLFRNFEAGFNEMPWINSAMPNRKTDINNRTGFSTDYIGQNYAYPEAGYEEREQIVEQHRAYQQGLMWTLANHPRVPVKVRDVISRWGPCSDEFTEGNGWQEQLYIREARRMIGATVMTQHHCQGRETVGDPVGMAAYTMDSHNVQRYVDADGNVQNEGDVEVGGFPPYPIGLGAIIPQADQCSNLLVPVCLSASHIAFGSIRMEPVFMVLGQSAATIAAHAIEWETAVQDVDYTKLRERLLADDQVLAYTRLAHQQTGVDPTQLPGVVRDDEESEGVKLEGFATHSTSIRPYVGAGYRTDGNAEKGRQSVTFSLTAPSSGEFEVRTAYTAHQNRASNVPVTILHSTGLKRFRVDQQQRPPVDGLWFSLGKFRMQKDETCRVIVGNEGTDGYVIIDAVQLLEANETEN